MCVCVCFVHLPVTNPSLCRPPAAARQAKYHEDFERTRGRGYSPGLDDGSMERYQRANQMIGEAGYSKVIHPQQGLEMDRRPGGIIVGGSHCVCVASTCWVH